MLAQLLQNPVKRVDDAKVAMRVQNSYDFDQLHRFWSSHAQPVRASIVLDVEMT